MRRNETIFNSKPITPQEAMISSFQTLTDFKGVNSATNCKSYTPSTSFWKPPLCGHVKLNTDAGHLNNNMWRLGAVYRSENGAILFTSSKDISGRLSPEIAEALAVRWAVELASL